MSRREQLILFGGIGLLWLGESLHLWTEYIGLNLMAGFVTFFLWNKVDALTAKLVAVERQLAARRLTETSALEAAIIERQARIERAQTEALGILLEHSEILAMLARRQEN